MAHIVIAPVGEHIQTLFAGIKDFPTERVILLTPEQHADKAREVTADLQKFQIPTQIKPIKGNLYEAMFEAVADIKKIEGEEKLLINVATGNADLRCAATSAAFVNGIRAFATSEKGSMLLPILKFSYYKMLTDRKLSILRALQDKDCCASLEELSKKTEMSLPLISYHVNGNLKSIGLKELGLIETHEEKGRIGITLSTMGRLLIRGYIG